MAELFSDKDTYSLQAVIADLFDTVGTPPPPPPPHTHTMRNALVTTRCQCLPDVLAGLLPVLQVNDNVLDNVSHAEAVQALQRASGTTYLTIEKPEKETQSSPVSTITGSVFLSSTNKCCPVSSFVLAGDYRVKASILLAMLDQTMPRRPNSLLKYSIGSF